MNPEEFRLNIESLHEQSRQIAEHTKQLQLDAEHIRAVVRIAELHDRRLSRLEGDVS